MSIKSKGNTLQIIGRVALGLLSLILVVGTALPLFHSNAWWIRVFDFPRIQIAVLMGLMLTGYAVLRVYGRLRLWEYALTALVGLALVWQIISIAPYTEFYPTEMSDSRADDDLNRISMLIYNVLSDNSEVQALRELISDTDPDIILLSEPNQRWLEQLSGLEEDYTYTLFQPQENSYGMLLYSRLELVNPEIQFLIEPGIPSFRSLIRLRSGKLVTLFVVHPRPPGRQEKDKKSEREDSDVRDAELLLVAQEAKELGDVPVIVAGDFNDVAWSRTTRLFQRIGGFLDPRVGRGFFNSFDTGSYLLRFPVDLVFASRHFFLVELRRLPDIGSDHFPMLVVLDYNPATTMTNEVPRHDDGDKKKANKAIKKGKSND